MSFDGILGQCHGSKTDRLEECQGEKSAAKGRDHNSELCVYGGHVEFVDESCYGGPVILDCNIASAAGGEEWGKWGTHEVRLCKIAPPCSITVANAASLAVTFLKRGRIGKTGTQEIALAIHAALNASRLGWVHRS